VNAGDSNRRVCHRRRRLFRLRWRGRRRLRHPSGNTISGFGRGVDLYRAQTTPSSGYTIQLTITGNNDITGNTTGVRVFDANATAAADAVAIITGNNASIHGNVVASKWTAAPRRSPQPRV
jgi:hypothetical protein